MSGMALGHEHSRSCALGAIALFAGATAIADFRERVWRIRHRSGVPDVPVPGQLPPVPVGYGASLFSPPPVGVRTRRSPPSHSSSPATATFLAMRRNCRADSTSRPEMYCSTPSIREVRESTSTSSTPALPVPTRSLPSFPKRPDHRTSYPRHAQLHPVVHQNHHARAPTSAKLQPCLTEVRNTHDVTINCNTHNASIVIRNSSDFSVVNAGPSSCMRERRGSLTGNRGAIFGDSTAGTTTADNIRSVLQLWSGVNDTVRANRMLCAGFAEPASTSGAEATISSRTTRSMATASPPTARTWSGRAASSCFATRPVIHTATGACAPTTVCPVP